MTEFRKNIIKNTFEINVYMTFNFVIKIILKCGKHIIFLQTVTSAYRHSSQVIGNYSGKV